MRWLLLIAVAGCGSRTTLGSDFDLGLDLDGSARRGDGATNGGGDPGAGTDASRAVDGASIDASFGDASAVCTMAMVSEVFGGSKQQCKMQITWTCGGTSYQIGLGCGETNPAGFGGACTMNGMHTGGWNDTTSSDGCSCSDVAKTVSLAAMKCGFPIPGEPN